MGKIIENYSLQEVLGEGVYGKVYKGFNIKTKQEVAVKVIRADKFREIPKLQECTVNEINILSSMEHNPHIVKYLDMLKTVNNFYFVYEYCNGGTLDKLLQSYKTTPDKVMPLNKALLILRDIIDAFKTLTKNNIMHRDLKPDNILIHNGVVKLADFGFCKSLKSPTDLAHTMLGSPIYMAPEVLRGEIYTMKADIWSLGVVLYEMIFGQCPFQSNSIAKLIQILQTQQIKFSKPLPEALEGLLRKMLVKDPTKRIDWVELFQYKITETGELIENKTTLTNNYLLRSTKAANSPPTSSLFNSVSGSSNTIMTPSSTKLNNSSGYSTQIGTPQLKNTTNDNVTYKGSDRSSGNGYSTNIDSSQKRDLRSRSPVPESDRRHNMSSYGNSIGGGINSYQNLENSGVRAPTMSANNSYNSKSPIRDRISKYGEMVKMHRRTTEATKLSLDVLKLAQLRELVVLTYLINKTVEKELTDLSEAIKKQLNTAKCAQEEEIMYMEFRVIVEGQLNHIQEVLKGFRQEIERFEPDINSVAGKRSRILKTVLQHCRSNNFYVDQDPDNLILTVQLIDYFDESSVLKKDAYRRISKEQHIRQVNSKISQLN